MKEIQQQIDELIDPLNQGGNQETAAIIESKLQSLLLSVQDEQKEKSELKAQELFAEQASVNGRAMTPSVVKDEMNRVDYAWEPTKEEV